MNFGHIHVHISGPEKYILIYATSLHLGIVISR
jgi:hypothetical protein